MVISLPCSLWGLRERWDSGIKSHLFWLKSVSVLCGWVLCTSMCIHICLYAWVHIRLWNWPQPLEAQCGLFASRELEWPPTYFSILVDYKISCLVSVSDLTPPLYCYLIFVMWHCRVETFICSACFWVFFSLSWFLNYILCFYLCCLRGWSLMSWFSVTSINVFYANCPNSIRYSVVLRCGEWNIIRVIGPLDSSSVRLHPSKHLPLSSDYESQKNLVWILLKLE